MGRADAFLLRNTSPEIPQKKITSCSRYGFRAVVFKLFRKLEAEGKLRPSLTTHGLRHTVATTLRELGCDLQTIADALGPSSPGMAMHYAREADLQKKMTGVVKRLDRRMNKTAPKAVKPTE